MNSLEDHVFRRAETIDFRSENGEEKGNIEHFWNLMNRSFQVAPNKQNQAVKRIKGEDEEKGDAENVELINEETDEAKKEKQVEFFGCFEMI